MASIGGVAWLLASQGVELWVSLVVGLGIFLHGAAERFRGAWS